MRANKFRRTAARNKITAVAGSDAHSAECVGLATVAVETGATQKTKVEAILRAIKEGKVKIKKRKRTPIWVYFSQLCKNKH